jgi:PAS domain S-box-containing protein
MKDTLDEKEKNFYIEYPCHSPSKKRWFGLRIMKFDNDEPMLVAAHLEITKRKLAEDKLLKNEAKLVEAQAIAHISSWEVDLLMNERSWSDELYHILGIKREEVEASNRFFLSFIHPDDYKDTIEEIKISLEAFQNASYHFRFIRNDGKVRYGYIEMKFEFDDNNQPIRLYGIMQDVTETKMAEEEREKIIADIVQRNKDLEQFSYIISHNLRAPVANIIGISAMAQDDSLEPDMKKEVLEGLAQSVQKLDDVISDLNNILQIKREVSQKKEKVSFTEIVTNIRISIENLIEKENAILNWDFSEIDEMQTLKSYLHSIFFNLISNSLKYRQPNIPPIIDIKSHKAGNKIELIFKDNGMGIDMKKKGEQVFGLYKRFHTDKAEGKGMGLYMVKTQFESIGGKITIESEVNNGTIFKIEFNLKNN